MTFTTRKLVGSRVHVSGTDLAGQAGSVVLDSTQWDELGTRKEYEQAAADFDEAVATFFAPLTAAAEAANASVKQPELDPTSYFVIEEGSEGVAPVSRQIVKLTHDSQVLRLLASGSTDRLIWVETGSGQTLEVLSPDQSAINAITSLIPEASEVPAEDDESE